MIVITQDGKVIDSPSPAVTGQVVSAVMLFPEDVSNGMDAFTGNVSLHMCGTDGAEDRVSALNSLCQVESAAERKLRGLLLSEVSGLKDEINGVFKKYSELGVVPRKIMVYEPGNVHGEDLPHHYLDIEVFSPGE